jgi:hypothetical protein
MDRRRIGPSHGGLLEGLAMREPKEAVVRQLRRMSLCLVLVGTLGAIAVSQASAALPEFVGPTPVPFTSTLKGTSTLETVSGLKITCTGGTDVGEVTGPKTLTIKILFTGCELNGLTCSTSRTKGGIETSTLTGTLGYIKQAKKQVGVDLSSPAGGPFMTFTCGEDLQIAVFGSVIGKITPVNKTILPPKKHFTLKFAQKLGKQKPRQLEGAPVDVLDVSVLGGPAEEAGLAATDLLYFPVPLEVKA